MQIRFCMGFRKKKSRLRRLHTSNSLGQTQAAPLGKEKRNGRPPGAGTHKKTLLSRAKKGFWGMFYPQ
ncbi:hypothetical protein JCM12214_17380 [Geobacillus vulcani]